jgi:hypothetical protein
MAEGQTDERVLGKIKALVDEEHALRSEPNLDGHRSERLEALRVELDQCWDLLRQRRALREFGGNPEQAKVRPPEIVENYEQ